jgi:2-oxoglutarate dehydrogenase E2 component (dihydrolipoamide succinyltransferase)
MHNIINRPICVGDQILARPMMYLALTYDHRLIDGREAATFLITGTIRPDGVATATEMST